MTGINLEALPKYDGPGIYIIRNTVDDMVYIGQSNNVRWRLFDHQKRILKNKRCNEKLKEAVNRYGLSSFRFEVLEQVPMPSSRKVLGRILTPLEQKWLERYRGRLYNTKLKSTTSSVGVLWSKKK